MEPEGEESSQPDDAHHPSAIEKIHHNMEFSRTDPSEISSMRTKLIQELKEPFIERVNSRSSFSYIKQVKIENFDERVMTLPDKEVFDLYAEYLKIRSTKSEKTREVVRDGILARIEQRILSDGSFLRRVFRRRNQ